MTLAMLTANSQTAFLLFGCLLAGSGFARSSQHGEIAVEAMSHKSGEPCSGGNIASILGLQRLPGGPIVTTGLDLQKIEPGSYFVYYKQSEFIGTSEECGESSGPPPPEGQWNRVPKVEVKIAAGKVHRLSLDRHLVPQVEVLDELPVTGMMVGGIYNVVSSFRLWTHICGDMFPDAEGEHRRRLTSSSIPKYEKLFGFTEQEAPRKEKATRLEQAQQTELQAERWCGVELPRAIEKFDYSYASRVSDVRDFLSKEAEKPRR